MGGGELTISCGQQVSSKSYLGVSQYKSANYGIQQPFGSIQENNAGVDIKNIWCGYKGLIRVRTQIDVLNCPSNINQIHISRDGGVTFLRLVWDGKENTNYDVDLSFRSFANDSSDDYGEVFFTDDDANKDLSLYVKYVA